jgi:hypothetical protein
MMRSLALLDHTDQETISCCQNRRLQFLVRLAAKLKNAVIDPDDFVPMSTS